MIESENPLFFIDQSKGTFGSSIEIFFFSQVVEQVSYRHCNEYINVLVIVDELFLNYVL